MPTHIALEYDNWLAYAEKHGMVLTVEKFNNLSTNSMHHVVQIDYVKFFVKEYGESVGAECNKVYDARTLFNRFKDTLIRKGTERKERGPVVTNLGVETREFHSYDVEYMTFNTNELSSLKIVNVEHDWLSFGSGDGFSRFMLWKDIIEMPEVFIDL